MAIIEYPEPEWGQCQPVEEACSSLVTTGITPYILKGIVIQLLRFHFGDCDNIINPALKGFMWCGDGAELPQCGTDGGAGGIGACATGPIIEPLPGEEPKYPAPVGEGCTIFIGGSGDLDLGQVGQRPGLFVHLGSTANKRVTALKGSSYPAAKNTVTGMVDGSKHANEQRGYINILVLSVDQTSCELLAEEIFYRMIQFSPVIQDDFRISRFSCTNLKESVKLSAGEQTTAWQSVVRIDWAMIYTWALKQEAPLLKRFYTKKLVCKQEIGE